MKKIILLLIVFISANEIFSQGMVKISPGTTVKSTNGVFMVMNNMNLVNNGVVQQDQNGGKIKFTGSTNESISGSGVTILDRLDLSINTGSVLRLQKNISVGSEFIFNSGLFNLDNYEMDLLSSGVLTNESESNRTYTTGAGFIKTTVLLNSPTSINPGNLGAVISSSTNLGNTIIRRGHKIHENIFEANSSVRRYFDIVPANNSNVNATLRLYYFDGELNGIVESDLNLWRSPDNINWTSVCNSIRNSVSNYVQSSGINNFSRWTLSVASPSLSVNIPDAKPLNYNSIAFNTVYPAYSPAASITFTAQASSGNGPYSYSWSNGATTQSIAVSPSSNTIYTVTATDANGCQSTASKEVLIKSINCNNDKVYMCHISGNSGHVNTICIDNNAVATHLAAGCSLGECIGSRNAPSAIEGEVKDFSIRVLPNPSKNYFTLTIRTSDISPISVRVMDVLGRVVEAWTNVQNGNLIFGNDLSAGVYLTEIIQGTNRKVIKLVKQ
jgi:hypothetical protein